MQEKYSNSQEAFGRLREETQFFQACFVVRKLLQLAFLFARKFVAEIEKRTIVNEVAVSRNLMV